MGGRHDAVQKTGQLKPVGGSVDPGHPMTPHRTRPRHPSGPAGCKRNQYPMIPMAPGDTTVGSTPGLSGAMLGQMA